MVIKTSTIENRLNKQISKDMVLNGIHSQKNTIKKHTKDIQTQNIPI